ncbi:hypothetical protein BJX76DRAFT_338396 [Aspergillus varians]
MTRRSWPTRLLHPKLQLIPLFLHHGTSVRSKPACCYDDLSLETFIPRLRTTGTAPLSTPYWLTYSSKSKPGIGHRHITGL